MLLIDLLIVAMYTVAIMFQVYVTAHDCLMNEALKCETLGAVCQAAAAQGTAPYDR